MRHNVLKTRRVAPNRSTAGVTVMSCVRTFSAFDAQRTGRITLDFGQVGKQERIYETKDGAGLLFHLMRSAQGDDPRLRPGEKSGRNGGKQQG
eukprot:1158657-Pelagomonas_calceolata.AAC.1